MFFRPKETDRVTRSNEGKSFREWTAGTPTDESAVCAADISRAALDLVSAGISIAFIPSECVEKHHGVQFVPLKDRHQALYMCILYGKWPEPPVWAFVEQGFRTGKDR